MTARKTTRRTPAEAVEADAVEVPQLDGAAIGSHTAAVDLTTGSKLIKYHAPPSDIAPEVGSTVTGTGVGASAVVVAHPEPTTEEFTVSVASTATSANVTVTFNEAGAPEQTGALVGTQADAVEAGYFGQRENNHADAEYAVPGLVDGDSPGDWDNKYDAPGGQNLGFGQ